MHAVHTQTTHHYSNKHRTNEKPERSMQPQMMHREWTQRACLRKNRDPNFNPWIQTMQE